MALGVYHMERQSISSTQRCRTIIFITKLIGEIMGMMNMGGSLRYDMSGRKRKNYKKNNPTTKRVRKDTGKPKKVQPKAVPEAHQEHMKKKPFRTAKIYPCGRLVGCLWGASWVLPEWFVHAFRPRHRYFCGCFGVLLGCFWMLF